jgi:hypothetical protein
MPDQQKPASTLAFFMSQPHSAPPSAAIRASSASRSGAGNVANPHRHARKNMNLRLNVFNALQCFGLESVHHVFLPAPWSVHD